MKSSNVYLLLYPKHKAFKIGKSNDVFKRGKELEKDWGKPDYKNSYYLEIDEYPAYTLEKALQLLANESSMNFNKGVAKKEFYKISALKNTLKYIEIFVSDKANKIKKTIVKGIKSPAEIKEERNYKFHHNAVIARLERDRLVTVKPTQSQLKIDRLTLTHKHLSQDVIKYLNESIESLKVVFRVSNILAKYNHRIRFEFSNEGDYEKLTIYHRKRLCSVLAHHLQFNLRSFSGMAGERTNCLRLGYSNEYFALTYNLNLDHTCDFDRSCYFFITEVKASFNILKKIAQERELALKLLVG